MTKAEKTAVIEELTQVFADSKYFYLTDCSDMPAASISSLRRICFEKGIKLRVVKNTLIKTALMRAQEQQGEEVNYEDLYIALKGHSALMFTDTGNMPARIIKNFQKDNDSEKPALKAAYIDSAIFVGEEYLDTLEKIKSKEELIADLLHLLQSPVQGLIGALQSGQNNVTGLLKALEERAS